MTPTTKLRFVEREDFTGDPANPVIRRILQQWWDAEGDEREDIVDAGGEWQDVPLEEEE